MTTDDLRNGLILLDAISALTARREQKFPQSAGAVAHLQRHEIGPMGSGRQQDATGWLKLRRVLMEVSRRARACVSIGRPVAERHSQEK